MAVTTEKSTQVTNLDATPVVRLDPIDLGGRVRVARVSFTQGAAAGDAGSTAELARVPANATVLPHLSKLYFSAFGAARTLNVGTSADEDLFATAVDVSAAGSLALDEADTTAVKDGVDNDGTSDLAIFAKVAGGTIPAAATIKGFIYYYQA